MLNALLWYFWTQVFALGGSFVSARWLRNLPDRGYGIGKAVGLLLGGYFYWILVTLGLAQNNSGAVLMALGMLLVIGYWLRRSNNQQPTTNNLIAIIATELLFALAFILCALYRAYNPEIQSSGGEKFMESLMLNAITRSSHFPPNDAWLSGFAISYYYFGYVILAMLTKISGIAPSIAFNLSGATIFALVMTSAFSVGFNLWKSHERGAMRRERRAESDEQEAILTAPRSQLIAHSSPLAAGLLTAIMLGLMGNMGGFMGVLRCGNVLPASVWQWLDVRELATQNTQCTGLRPSAYFYEWWWDWSRVVKDYALTTSDQGKFNTVEVITETPAFSFVLGDNHPHTLALPFVLIAIAFAMNAVSRNRTPLRSDRAASSRRSPIPTVVLGAIVAGGFAFLNTWDFPVYGALMVGGLVLGRKLRNEPLWPALVQGIAMLALGYLLYLPFYVTFSSQARGISVNLFNGTRFPQFFLMFAPFILAFAAFIAYVISTNRMPMRMAAKQTAGLTVGAVLTCLVAVIAFGLLSPQGRALAAELRANGTVMGVTRDVVNARLLERATSPWTALILCLGIAACASLFITTLRPHPLTPSPPHPFSPSPPLLIALALFALGAALTLAPEFIYLQDLFGTRMNTVFKFYYQAWVLWSVAGAFSIMCLISDGKLWARVVGGVVILFVAAGMLFPLLASFSKTNNFAAQPTLDGAAELQNSHPNDAKAIAWLNKNVAGDPVILERPSKGSYGYEGRISAFTGLPTPLGWGGHQNQWRGTYDEPGKREPLIASLYNTTDLVEARNLLNQLNVIYVVVGDTERNNGQESYAAEGLAKFANLCGIAFTSTTSNGDGGTTIYKCR